MSTFAALIGDLRSVVTEITDIRVISGRAAFSLNALMRTRIFVEGVASNGEQIGRYSQKYLKIRETVLKRGSDTNVILVATAQMLNDWSVIPRDGANEIILGFKNDFNIEKAVDNEGRFRKTIFEPTESEEETTYQIIEATLNEILRSKNL